MPAFPSLSTGAVAQYPLAASFQTGTVVIRFLDGQDQRCLTTSGPLRRWAIKLDQLSEVELFALEQFFIDTEGSYGTFSFTDPESGVTLPNCRFQDSNLALTYLEPGRGATELVVVEIRA